MATQRRPAKKAKTGRTNRTPKKASAPDWAPRLLSALRDSANIRLACEASGIGRRTFYDRRDADPAFAAEVKLALADGCDLMEAEARRRAVDGLLRKKFTKSGAPVIDPATGVHYAEREYSDTLLIFLLKAHAPEKFRESVKHEHTGAGGGPVQFIEVAGDAAPADRGSDPS